MEITRFSAKDGLDMAMRHYDIPLSGEGTWTPQAVARICDLETANADLAEINRRLRSHVQSLEKLAFLDPLTGIGNRRYFTSSLRAELRRAARNNSSLGLVLCDIDDFKACNDQYGHQTGDAVLVAVSETLRRFCRRSGDLAFRHGGDEFALILPDARAEALRPLCEALRNAIKSMRLSDQRVERVTVSIGGALLHESTPHYAAAFIGIADRALYRAKRDSKDCVKINISTGRHAVPERTASRQQSGRQGDGNDAPVRIPAAIGDSRLGRTPGAKSSAAHRHGPGAPRPRCCPSSAKMMENG